MLIEKAENDQRCKPNELKTIHLYSATWEIAKALIVFQLAEKKHHQTNLMVLKFGRENGIRRILIK